jgi:Haem-binding domain
MLNKRNILIGLGIVLLVIQFIRPERNYSNDQSAHLSTIEPIPPAIEALLKAGCYDCHSNYTNYTPFINLQPVGWWMTNHVNHGKKHLNFSEFAKYDSKRQHHKWEEIAELVENGAMPLSSYTWLGLHPSARFTPEQRQLMIDWAKSHLDTNH